MAVGEHIYVYSAKTEGFRHNIIRIYCHLWALYQHGSLTH